jgi:hypothetical protein
VGFRRLQGEMHEMHACICASCSKNPEKPPDARDAPRRGLRAACIAAVAPEEAFGRYRRAAAVGGTEESDGVKGGGGQKSATFASTSTASGLSTDFLAPFEKQ